MMAVHMLALINPQMSMARMSGKPGALIIIIILFL